jgi:FkbM family methyltransferase
MFDKLRYFAWQARNMIRGDYSSGDHVYGQFAEDLLIWHAMDLGRAKKLPRQIRYLDIGANDPIHISNTFFAYRKGATGVLVEPNPLLTPRLRKIRPRDVVIEAGVAAHSSTLAFHAFDPHVLGTFSPEIAAKQCEMGYREVGISQIRILPIAEILETHFVDSGPDFISIDAEGFDLEIVRAIDWSRWRPIVVCIETWDMTANRNVSEIDQIMDQAGYSEFGRIGPNTIFRCN